MVARKQVRLPLSVRFLRLGGTAIIALLVGGGCGHTHPLTLNGIHWSAVFPYFFLIPGAIVWLITSQRYVPWRHAAPWIVSEVCLLWSGFAAGWLMTTTFIGAYLGALLLGLMVSLIMAPCILILFQMYFCRLTCGPYCPNCKYCLIGSVWNRCPECGRPFTLSELGVTARELIPTTLKLDGR